MFHTLRSWIETANGVVAIFGGLASVAIAVFAILIQQEINASDQRRAQVDRSIALFDQFASSDAVNHLTTLSGFVEFEIHQTEPDPEKTDAIKQLSARLMAVRAREDPEFYDHMTQLLQQISVITRCGDFMAASERAICDQETIFALFGDSIMDLFFRLRPVMYCDSYFRTFRSAIESFETIVSTYLQKVKGVERGIYPALDDVPRLEREEGDYILLEFGPRAFCQPFQPGQQTASLDRARG